MTDPRRPEKTDDPEAADAAADATVEEELESDEELEALEADEDELETKVLPSAAVAAPAGGTAGAKPTVSRDKQPRTTPSAAVVDELPYVDDRVSKIWVVLIAATFAAIFVYGLLFGGGGILSTRPSPEPTASRPPSASPSASPTNPASPTARPSVTPGTSGTALPSQLASPSRAPSPTAPTSPTAGPT